jgi:hypothetical protein
MDHAVSLPNTIVAWIGLHWADPKHDICLQATGSTEIGRLVVEQKPEALHIWVAELRRRFPYGPMAIALEQSRGALFYALMKYEFLQLYALFKRPRQLSFQDVCNSMKTTCRKFLTNLAC